MVKYKLQSKIYLFTNADSVIGKVCTGLDE
jgi:hypothetical protein